MMSTPPGADQQLLRRIAHTARRQRCRTGSWPHRIRVDGIVWHLVDVETYRTNLAGEDREACFTHGRDSITPGTQAGAEIERIQLLIH